MQAGDSLLETQTPTISQVIEGRQVQDTPLNGRNAMNLIALTPGLVAQGASGGAPSANNVSNGAFSNAVGYGNYSISGSLASVGSVYIDGAPVNLLIGHEVGYIITQDAVQEFRVQSSVVNPQYGASAAVSFHSPRNPKPASCMEPSTSTCAITSSTQIPSSTTRRSSMELRSRDPSSRKTSLALPPVDQYRMPKHSSSSLTKGTGWRRVCPTSGACTLRPN